MMDDWDTKFKLWKEAKNRRAEFENSPKKNTRTLTKGVRFLEDNIKTPGKIISQKLDLVHRPRLKIFLTVIAYLIPLLILNILVFFIFKPVIADSGYSYSVDVGVKGDDSAGKPLYLITSKALSPLVLYGNESYRELR